MEDYVVGTSKVKHNVLVGVTVTDFINNEMIGGRPTQLEKHCKTLVIDSSKTARVCRCHYIYLGSVDHILTW